MISHKALLAAACAFALFAPTTIRAQGTNQVVTADAPVEGKPKAQAKSPAARKASKMAKAKKDEKGPPKPLEPWAAVDPSRVAQPADDPAKNPADPKSSVPTAKWAKDPIDLGMKVNGSNVTPAQTREQNYNGNVTGIGGELGVRLHF